MMKKTQWLDARRTIRRKWVSWLSIIVIAMLATIAFLGVSYSARSTLDSACACYNAQNFMDIELVSPELISGDDVETILGAEGVADAEGVMAIPSRVSSEQDYQDIILRTGSERISLPEWTGGRAPEAADECAAEEILAKNMGWEIGDTVELNARDPESDLLIRHRTLRITGTFRTAEHLGTTLHEERLILVTPGAFNTALMGGKTFSKILVRVADAPEDRFSAAYGERLDAVRAKWDEEGRWIGKDLRSQMSYRFMKGNAENLDKISYSFSMLFIVIAMLVIYASIGRMVEQDGRLVGAEKAMGLRNSEVLGKYLVYGVSATAAGVLLGIALAYFGLLRFILIGFGLVFLFTERVTSFLPVHTAAVAAGALGMSVAAVCLGCARLLRSTAVTLMQGTALSALKAKAGSGGSHSLYIRLIFRNMWNDRKRVLVTVISIAGSCALLVIGFSVRFSVARVPERQYGQIMRYNLEAMPDLAKNPMAIREASAILTESDTAHAAAFVQNVPGLSGNDFFQLRLICMDQALLPDYFCLADAETGMPLSLPRDGILIPRRLAETCSLRAGDRFTLFDSGMNRRETMVAGVFENYLDLPAFCSPEEYERTLGGKAEPNMILLSAGAAEAATLRERLQSVKGFLSLSSAETYRDILEGFSTILNLVILLLGLLAVMISCFILLNLVNTYVSNKTRELTIMRINGFTTGETIRYASLESYATTAAGILLGLAAGWLLSAVICRSIDQPFIQMVRDPFWVSFAAPALITAVISAVIHYQSFRKIRDLKLSDLQ